MPRHNHLGHCQYLLEECAKQYKTTSRLQASKRPRASELIAVNAAMPSGDIPLLTAECGLRVPQGFSLG